MFAVTLCCCETIEWNTFCTGVSHAVIFVGPAAVSESFERYGTKLFRGKMNGSVFATSRSAFVRGN